MDLDDDEKDKVRSTMSGVRAELSAADQAISSATVPESIDSARARRDEVLAARG